ncbi:hypothetical protein NLB65_01255 [Candidatus Aminicenantes bacterium AC-335-B20]|jgi:hypothetical protein|nr:hypothetical protein [SCandidatus Aminicenantes bacterium Aminicenantia_JdfR_composite]MCP2597663.1 hypothetical protein [Candidatus Aminicenantes bacterium AC-335-G13]MCP2599071.1 hypothetical protein [Candidatus Aminicenantes bacterium AC-335-B20]MCP2606403.1 hypothetical protein [Candidatus Aminicenantes bacterium AC-708-I09]MCP2619073.1 hypothetical protein [Candidatus Aminicenantes bacterium AC-335-A11]
MKKNLLLLIILGLILCFDLILIKYLFADEPKSCTPTILCKSLAREHCVEDCGGKRNCKNYTLEEAWCDGYCICRSEWLIECTGPWEWFYWYCDEYRRTCCR